jgi:opacity protein-like surface antigen
VARFAQIACGGMALSPQRSAVVAAACVAALVLLTPDPVRAGGWEPTYVGPPPFSWSGLYVGYRTGGAWGSTHASDPFGSSIFGDQIRTPGGFAGGQLGANAQLGSVVVGVESDLSWAELDGTNTCFAYSGFFISANCHAHTKALATLTGHLGLATGAQGRTLLYAKGGAAWQHQTFGVTPNGDLGLAATSSTVAKFGWTAGGGIEQALGGNWSVMAEYDYLAFGGAKVAAPDSVFQSVAGNPGTFVAVPGTVASASQDVHQFKVGVNYKFGDATASPSDDGSSQMDAAHGRAWGYELGGRYWVSASRFQKDIGSPNLASRLTYDGITDRSGELFARIDTPSRVFVKGLAGIGSTQSGHMNDEDWGIPADPPNGILAFVPYSNTLQGTVAGGIQYATIDVGRSWVRTPELTVGPFLGLNVFRQNLDSYGCAQLANANGPCGNVAFPNYPTSVPNIFQHNTWGSLRLGTALDFALTNRVKVSADAAYLPFVLLYGVDDHYFLSSGGTAIGNHFTEWGYGRGAQLEAIVSFAVTEQFSLGVGVRYWSMWATDKVPDIFNVSTSSTNIYRSETAGLYLQGSYKFGESCCAGSFK